MEKAKHYDKDERYMATSDLKAELEKVQGQIDADLQIPIREMVLTQLDDGSDEVQSIAVSCLSAIITKFKNSEIFEISQKLGKSLIEGKSEMKDSYSDGLQNIINAVDISLAEGIGDRVMDNLMRGLKDVNPEERDTINFVLNVLETLLNRFGSRLGKYHQTILHALLPLLESENLTLRKRGAVALAALVRSLDDALFEELISAVIAKIDGTRNDAKLYNYIQTIGIVGRHAGVRIGKYLHRIVPLLVRFCSDESGRSAEETLNLRENCLQAFESLIRECPSDITPHIDSLVSLAVKFISHDPNWAGEDGKQSQKDEDGDTNMEDDGDAGFGDEDDDDDGFGDDGGDWDDGDVQFDDDEGGDGGKTDEGWDDVGAVTHEDDDEAWRVRRAAVKVVASFIATASSTLLLEKFNAVSNALVDRFTDRDIDVKVEVFHAIRDLMSSTVRMEETTEDPLDAPSLMRLPSIGDVPALVRSQSAGLLLEEHVSSILSGILTQLKTPNAKTKAGAFSVLRELIIVRDGGLENWLKEIFERVAESCTDRDTVLREKALDLVELLLARHRASTCRQYIPSLVECIVASVSSKSGATTACRVQAFGCIEACVKVLRPDSEAMLTGEESVESVKAFYDAALEQMKLLDVEQSVKVASISAVAAILVRFGDSLPLEALPLFLDRLGNRVTRLAALRAFVALSESKLNIDLSSVKQRALKVIVQFLKQVSPEVTHEAAAALKALLQSNNKDDVSGIYLELLADVADFISPKDFFLSHLVLDVISTMLEAEPSLVIDDGVISKCFALLDSPLLQGSEALPSLQRFFAGLLHSTSSKQTYDKLLKNLTASVKKGMSPECFASISQCVAAISVVASDADQDKTVKRFVSEVESKEDSTSQMALLSLGEIGRRKDLSASLAGKAVFNAFAKEQTELKMAASFALGSISVSNLAFYLKDLLEKVDKAPKYRYLLLNSLKEVVNYHYLNYNRMPKLRQYSSIVLPVLLNNSVSKDEGEQNLLAECLGKMIIVDPQSTMPLVEGNLSVPDANTRAVMVASIKYSLGGGPEIQGLLREKMEKFLNLMNDDQYQEWVCARCKARNPANVIYCTVQSCKETRIVLPVERQAFMAFTAILKDNVQLVSTFLHKDTPEQPDSPPLRAVYKACIYRKELLKEIELGATKIRQDQGLPLRKAAYGCMEQLARNAYRWINFKDYISYLSNGLKDPDFDVLVLTYQIFQRLAKSRGANILSEIDKLPAFFLHGLKEQLKLVKQKNPLAEHIKTVVLTEAMRALQAINDIPGCQSLSAFQKFMKKVMKTPTLVEIRNKMRAADMKNKQKNSA